ncbi:serpin family protein [Spongiactinospora sp. 9N601]|uniref:serpin family protein n=1 Tax=Spongiactinospora sp. 9N601 TaxID=3375149 RepID=UPI0037ACA1D4
MKVGESGVLTAEGVSREVAPADAPVPQVVQGMTAFGHSLHAKVAKPGENTVISPLSIAYAYGLARAGAAGETGARIDQVFGFPGQGPHTAFNSLTADIITVDGVPPKPDRGERDAAQDGEPADPIVGIANGLFAQHGLPVKPGFLKTAKSQYDAGLHAVDFAGEATKTIDKWVTEQTAGRINKLFDSLDPATKLVLANAVYLKADWEKPFTAEPAQKAPFTLADGSRKTVELMKQSGNFRYAKGSGWQAVELPYAKSDLAMWVLVPDAGGAPGDLLKAETLQQVGSNLADTRVGVFLPRWDFGTDLDLMPPMSALGLGAGGDFSGISDGLTLKQAVHRANITVDEHGTEAAAVTGLAFPVSAAPEAETTVRADHPFAFAIVHKKTGAPLFMGQVSDPAKK